MRLGETANEQAAQYGKPLDGVRILAVEQMQALPYSTQLLARLGADVVKVEHPVDGESGRASRPQMLDPRGRGCGATFLRNNLDKRSLGIDLKSDRGRALLLDLVPRFDVFAENFKPGTMDRLGLGYDVVSGVHPAVIYLSVSGFGNLVESPYKEWPAYAPIVEAMSGILSYKLTPDKAPPIGPAGALGDISSAMFGVIGTLAALIHRDRTGEGQWVDVAMLDSMISMGDVVTNLWSLGVRPDPSTRAPLIVQSFKASDGFFVIQVIREHQFDKLADTIGHPEWKDDTRFADRTGWVRHLDGVIRPAIEEWASTRTKQQACEDLTRGGVAAGPSNFATDVIQDPHVAARNMLVEMERTDGVEEPVLIPGNPVKMSKVMEGPETRVPWVGEHTEEILRAELDLDPDSLAELRDAGVIS